MSELLGAGQVSESTPALRQNLVLTPLAVTIADLAASFGTPVDGDNVFEVSIGHAPDVEVHEILVSMDEDPFGLDSDGTLSFRVFVPRQVDPENPDNPTIGSLTVGPEGWQKHVELRMQSVAGIPDYGVPLVLEVTGFLPHGVPATSAIWKNVAATTVTIFLMKRLPMNPADPYGAYGDAVRDAMRRIDEAMNPTYQGR